MLNTNKKDPYAFSRLMYIFEAAFEYFILMYVGNVYIATIAEYIGMSDSLVAILSSLVSLSCGFQLVALFLANKRPVKVWVSISHVVSQLLFACVYLVPVFPMSKELKPIILFAVYLSAYVIHQIIHSPKINWYMSLIDDKKRGRFTANKEIVSLIGGMIFSYTMGNIMDYFKAQNNMRLAFIVGAITIFILTVLHTLTLVFAKEKEVPADFKPIPLKKVFANLLRNKTLLKVILISVFWALANSSMHFMGTYQKKELGFSLTFCSIVVMIGSFSRVLFSKPMGRLADKTSFANMLNVCFIIAGVGFFINMFTVKETGIFYVVFYVLYCIAMAGINSATINLIFDYVDKDERTTALALKSTLSGFTGFFITLILTPLFSYIQANGNKIFGISMYAQQLFSLFSVIFTLILIIYLNLVIRKIPKKTDK